MTSKDAVIKLFEEKMAVLPISMNIQDGSIYSGFNFFVGDKKYFVGIADARIVFGELDFNLTTEEFVHLGSILQQRKTELEDIKRKERKIKQIQDLKVLEKIVATENLYTNRRVLTEKRTNNTDFKI